LYAPPYAFKLGVYPYCVGKFGKYLLWVLWLARLLGFVTKGGEVVVIGGATLPGPTALVGIFCNS